METSPPLCQYAKRGRTTGGAGFTWPRFYFGALLLFDFSESVTLIRKVNVTYAYTDNKVKLIYPFEHFTCKNLCDNGFRMDTAALTQVLVRLFGGEESLAATAGVSQSTVNRWAHGGEVKGKNLLKLIDLARDVPEAAHLIEGVVTPTPVDTFKPDIIPGKDLVGERNFPIYAAAMGGDGHQIVTFDAIDYVKRPAVLENVKNAYGLYIVGESMTPAFEPGDMALVHPHLPPARDKNVVLYHVPPLGSNEAEAIVKRLVRYNDQDWILKQYNPEREFTETRADWPYCHRIVGKYESR